MTIYVYTFSSGAMAYSSSPNHTVGFNGEELVSTIPIAVDEETGKDFFNNPTLYDINVGKGVVTKKSYAKPRGH